MALSRLSSGTVTTSTTAGTYVQVGSNITANGMFQFGFDFSGVTAGYVFNFSLWAIEISSGNYTEIKNWSVSYPISPSDGTTTAIGTPGNPASQITDWITSTVGPLQLWVTVANPTGTVTANTLIYWVDEVS